MWRSPGSVILLSLFRALLTTALVSGKVGLERPPPQNCSSQPLGSLLQGNDTGPVRWTPGPLARSVPAHRFHPLPHARRRHVKQEVGGGVTALRNPNGVYGLGPQPSVTRSALGCRRSALDGRAWAPTAGSRPLMLPTRPQAGTRAPGGCRPPAAWRSQGLGSLRLARCLHTADRVWSGRDRGGGRGRLLRLDVTGSQTGRSRLRMF